MPRDLSATLDLNRRVQILENDQEINYVDRQLLPADADLVSDAMAREVPRLALPSYLRLDLETVDCFSKKKLSTRACSYDESQACQTVVDRCDSS